MVIRKPTRKNLVVGLLGYSIVSMFRHGGKVSDMESSVATHMSYNNVAVVAGNATVSTVLEGV